MELNALFRTRPFNYFESRKLTFGNALDKNRNRSLKTDRGRSSLKADPVGIVNQSTLHHGVIFQLDTKVMVELTVILNPLQAHEDDSTTNHRIHIALIKLPVSFLQGDPGKNHSH